MLAGRCAVIFGVDRHAHKRLGLMLDASSKSYDTAVWTEGVKAKYTNKSLLLIIIITINHY